MGLGRKFQNFLGRLAKWPTSFLPSVMDADAIPVDVGCRSSANSRSAGALRPASEKTLEPSAPVISHLPPSFACSHPSSSRLDLRERDGVPDLRRGARSKFASVTLPEIDGSVKKMLKSGRDAENALIAVVIRNLKIVKEESKVIIMDANGAQSKAIARSLKRFGVKRPYLVKGGFESWAKKSLRVKELQPETALTVLNEEAEAILEDIKPTPTLVIGYALGISAAIYALLEWEKTLQVIGIVGLGLTLYRRVTSYEDSEDLKQDVRLLLTPVTLGARAFSWVARKVEPNKIGLPTSPSTTAVQDRVLQAAAKHESQPADDDGNQASGPATENLVSEA